MISSKPSQYVKGWVEFYKLRFKVAPDVLIPRPETELLVDEVTKFAKGIASGAKQSLTILDLGTGSGNIAISIAKNLPQNARVKIVATDISEKALKIAGQNAKLHGVEDRIEFIQSDLLSYVHLPGALVWTPDVIVTNLPYIPSERIPYLDSSVKDFEPHIALDGGNDGFDLYRKLFQQIKQLSNPGLNLNLQTGIVGWQPKLIVGEIDYTHGELAVNEAQKYFPEAEIEVKTDLTHKQRILLIRQLL